MTGKTIKVGIVGGTGYTGVELLRLLAQHPHSELRAITSASNGSAPSMNTTLPSGRRAMPWASMSSAFTRNQPSGKSGSAKWGDSVRPDGVEISCSLMPQLSQLARGKQSAGACSLRKFCGPWGKSLQRLGSKATGFKALPAVSRISNFNLNPSASVLPGSA